MEPLDEKELSQLLRRWQAPETPSSLSHKVLSGRPPWWRWLMTGTIRIPVPMGIAAIAVFAAWMWYSRPAPVQPSPPSASTTLADFQPVPQLEPKIVGKDEDNNELPEK